MTEGALDLTDAEGTDLLEVELGELITRMDVDREVPTAGEAAAIAAAIGAHLADREAAEPADSDTVDPWSFAGRLERTATARPRRPRTVERGREWQAAARTG